jgi:hypothetical protein
MIFVEFFLSQIHFLVPIFNKTIIGLKIYLIVKPYYF